MNNFVLDPWVQGYLDYLKDVRRLSPRTLIDIRCTLKRISRTMEELRPRLPLWKATLDDHLEWLNKEREQDRTEKSLGKDISHMRGFLEYSWRSGRSDRNVLDGFSLQNAGKHIMPRTLELEEAKQLVKVCGNRTKKERRDRLIILLLYGCGLRTSELGNLSVGDVDVERQEIFIRLGKGGKERKVPVPQGVWTELLAYLTERKGKRGPLFRTQVKQKRISPKEIGSIVRDAAQRAGISGTVTPRTLRHTFATHLMDADVSLAVIATLMGHNSPRQSGVYIHALSGRREDAVDLLFNDKETK